MTFNLYFDLPRKTSPRWCSRGSPGGWSWVSFEKNLHINTEGWFTEKNDDEWLINCRDTKVRFRYKKKIDIKFWFRPSL